MGPIAHFIVTPDGGGPHDERAMLEATIEADRLYATDWGYTKHLTSHALGPRAAFNRGHLRRPRHAPIRYPPRSTIAVPNGIGPAPFW